MEEGNSRKGQRFDDTYVYSEDYSPSESRTYYEDDRDYDSLRQSREEKDTGDDIGDLNAFSDVEVSLALSMLTEHELDQLDSLIDDDDQQDIYNAQKRKRECHGESCTQVETDGARSVRDSNSERGQLASFRSWFSRNKTTKTTRKTTTTTTTTTRKPSSRTVKTRPPTKPTRKSPSTKINKPQRFHPDTRNILRYGSNKDARDMIDKHIRDKINFLTGKIKRRADQRSATRLSSTNRKNRSLQHRNAVESSIRRKRNSDVVSGTRGTLEDSFPHPGHETASFHAPMEPLVRVKRGPLAV